MVPLEFPATTTMKTLYMMKKLIAAALCMAGMLAASTAHAGIYKIDFATSAIPLGVMSGTAPVQDQIAGSIMFEAASLTADVDAITSVDLMIGAHRYTVAEVGGQRLVDGYMFGALLNGIGGGAPGTDDFTLAARDFPMLFFATASVNDFWAAPSVSFTYSAVPVPEPVSSGLVLAALGALSIARRRTNRA
jgi:hypothetical protein